jgi:hypothetical protein
VPRSVHDAFLLSLMLIAGQGSEFDEDGAPHQRVILRL